MDNLSAAFFFTSSPPLLPLLINSFNSASSDCSRHVCGRSSHGSNGVEAKKYDDSHATPPPTPKSTASPAPSLSTPSSTSQASAHSSNQKRSKAAPHSDSPTRSAVRTAPTASC